jgi:hypothetical protein
MANMPPIDLEREKQHHDALNGLPTDLLGRLFGRLFGLSRADLQHRRLPIITPDRAIYRQ